MARVRKPTKDELNFLLKRGVEKIITTEELKNKLNSGQRIKMYLGIDPTGPQLHLGHAVLLRKLKKFQELGHKIILLFGDFTAQIGDPTGRTDIRVPLTKKEIAENEKDYVRQAKVILDFDSKTNPIEIKHNSKWLSKLNFDDVVQLSMLFTVQQFLERDMYQERLKKGLPIGLHEFLYPLMQGYDCVAMDVDMEAGGSDQLFNILTGRSMMEKLTEKKKIVYTTSLLEGTDGRKMSKSFKNIVPITDPPNEMYGKIMSMRDELITTYFELCTDVPAKKIEKIKSAMALGENPRDFKMELAHEIVALYHTQEKADQAQKYFVNVFQKKQQPDQAVIVPLEKGIHQLVDVLVEAGLTKSRKESRRVIKQKGVRINDKTVENKDKTIVMPEDEGLMIQKGKIHFIKLKTN